MTSLATWFTPSLQTISRSSGRSAVAASAYRACTLIYDERTGITHDFRPKAKNGLAKNICVGIKDNDLSAFWNNAEKAEIRAKATVARELMLPLPSEWSDKENEDCVLEIAQMLNAKYHVGVQASIHRAPPKRNNPTQHISFTPQGKNKHVHIMFSTREIDEYNYLNGGFGKKTRVLDEGLKNGEIKKLREAVASIVNAHAQQNGNDWFVIAGKYSEHITDHIPTHHISVNHGKKQKQYIDQNRAEVKEARNELSKLQKQIDDIDEKINELTKVEEQEVDYSHAFAEYMDLVNTHGQTLELLDTIMERTEVGNLTDFWHPDSQETLEQKFNSTKAELEKLTKRKEELEKLLQVNNQNMDYTQPEQVLTNAPSRVNTYHNTHENELVNARSTIDHGWSM